MIIDRARCRAKDILVRYKLRCNTVSRRIGADRFLLLHTELGLRK